MFQLIKNKYKWNLKLNFVKEFWLRLLMSFVKIILINLQGVLIKINVQFISEHYHLWMKNQYVVSWLYIYGQQA